MYIYIHIYIYIYICIYIYILIIVYPCGIMLDAFAECGISEVGQINKTELFCDSESHAYAIIRQILMKIIPHLV